MAKDTISQYSKTAGSNTDIQSVSIAEGMAPSDVNNAIRELMVDLASLCDGTQSLTTLKTTTPLLYSNETGITAGATQTQGGATALTTEINTVTTVGTNGDGVKLPTAVAGQKVRIYNTDSAQYLRVWPNTSDTIDGGSANAVDGNAILFGGWREYIAYDATNWLTTAQSAMTAAGSFTYDTATATGTQSITGVGFKPIAIHIHANEAAVAGNASWGFAAGTNEFTMRDNNASTAGSYNPSDGQIVNLLGDITNRNYAALNSMDTDGFTLGWTKTGSPTGTATVQYLAFR